jgi:hypothetical protein
MLNRFVTTAGSVPVIVVLMLLVVFHGVLLSIPTNGILIPKVPTLGSQQEPCPALFVTIAGTSLLKPEKIFSSLQL